MCQLLLLAQYYLSNRHAIHTRTYAAGQVQHRDSTPQRPGFSPNLSQVIRAHIQEQPTCSINCTYSQIQQSRYKPRLHMHIPAPHTGQSRERGRHDSRSTSESINSTTPTPSQVKEKPSNATSVMLPQSLIHIIWRCA